MLFQEGHPVLFSQVFSKGKRLNIKKSYENKYCIQQADPNEIPERSEVADAFLPLGIIYPDRNIGHPDTFPGSPDKYFEFELIFTGKESYILNEIEGIQP
jgi:hypothetical protein